MDREIAGIGISVIVIIMVVILIFGLDNRYNSEIHSEDIQVTEWISPDGVHYWYQEAGYHAMLAPRYDAEGNLVIDK